MINVRLQKAAFRPSRLAFGVDLNFIEVRDCKSENSEGAILAGFGRPVAGRPNLEN
jgi:hypothetical protein